MPKRALTQRESCMFQLFAASPSAVEGLDCRRERGYPWMTTNEGWPKMTVVESARATMNSYLKDLVARGNFAQYFAPDVTFQIMWSNQELARGPQAVEATIRYFHEQAFDANPELKCLLVDGDHATAEMDFVGRHVAEFAGKPATGKNVRVPYIAMYDLEGDRIKALRIYLSMDELMRQL
jgi:predicted ester cyclase